MKLTPREKDKLMVSLAAMVARDRKVRGVKLNYPETIALITDFVVEGAPGGVKRHDRWPLVHKPHAGHNAVVAGQLDAIGLFPDVTAGPGAGAVEDGLNLRRIVDWRFLGFEGGMDAQCHQHETEKSLSIPGPERVVFAPGI